MIYSLSEIDANCKKAARGAGLAWGYAEEAGKAARWLAAHQLPGAALLADYLTLRRESPEDYRGADAGCPLIMGASLCDAGRNEGEESIVLARVVSPLLLLPYLVQLSRAAGMGLRIQWSGTHISCHEGVIYIEENASITASKATVVSCDWLAADACASINISAQKKGAVGQFIEPSDW